MKAPRSLILTALLIVQTGVSQAAITTFTDRTTWSGNGTVLYTEDFESYVRDTYFATTPVDVGPFTLSTIGTAAAETNLIDVSPFFDPPIPASFGNAAVDIFVEGPLMADLAFDNPVSGFFADFWAAGNTTELTLTLSLLGGGSADVNVPGPGNALESFGFFSDTDLITAIRFNNSVNDGFKMDNIAASVVPVPAAVWLFGTALLGFVGYSRRRKID